VAAQHARRRAVPRVEPRYGVLWDNLSFTRFGDLRELNPFPTNCLIDASNQPGGLTTGTFTTTNSDQVGRLACHTDISFVSKNRTHVWHPGKAKSFRHHRRLSTENLFERPHQNVAGRKGSSLSTGGRAG